MIEERVRDFLLMEPATTGCSTNNTFLGVMRPSKGGFPVEAVCVQPYGGLMPHGYLDGTDSKKTQLKTDVQIRVRGRVNSYVATKARANAIWNYMNMPSSVTISSSTIQFSIVQPINSSPLDIGENAEGQPEFTVNVRLWAIINNT